MKYLEGTMYALVVCALSFFLYITFLAKPNDEHGIIATIPAMLDYFEEDTDKLILLTLTPTCPYCLKSYPFYRTVIENKSQDTKVVAGVNPAVTIELQRRLLLKEGVDVDTLITIPTVDWGIASVPTIILLDNDAKVQDVWIGLLDTDREKEVLSAVAR